MIFARAMCKHTHAKVECFDEFFLFFFEFLSDLSCACESPTRGEIQEEISTKTFAL